MPSPTLGVSALRCYAPRPFAPGVPVPPVTRRDATRPASTTGTSPALPASPASTAAATTSTRPATPSAWTAAPPTSSDGFASAPASLPGTARWLPKQVTLNDTQLAAATAKYGPEAGARLKAWGDLLGSLSGLPERDQVAKVHDFLTFAAVYASDEQHYGKKDYWATPTELIATGAGDCEDFALARYASLRQIGIPPEQLQLAYVKRGEEAHMVLLYREKSGGEPWVMDNLEMDMLRTPGRQDLTPVFGFNEQHLWATRTLGDISTPAGSPTRLSLFQDWLGRVGAGQ